MHQLCRARACARPCCLTTPRRAWQLCKACNAQLYNVTADGNNVRTVALSREQRGRLGGVEYLLSEVAPGLGAAEQMALLRALHASAATYLAGSRLEAELRTTRPWKASDVYSAAATRAAVEAVHLALQLELSAAVQQQAGVEHTTVRARRRLCPAPVPRACRPAAAPAAY